MKKTTTIYSLLFSIICVLLIYILIVQPKVRAGNEILEIQQRLAELDTLEQQAKANWQIAEESKTECVASWNEQQQKESENAQGYRAEKKKLEDRLGLLVSRQAQ